MTVVSLPEFNVTLVRGQAFDLEVDAKTGRVRCEQEYTLRHPKFNHTQMIVSSA